MNLPLVLLSAVGGAYTHSRYSANRTYRATPGVRNAYRYGMPLVYRKASWEARRNHYWAKRG